MMWLMPNIEDEERIHQDLRASQAHHHHHDYIETLRVEGEVSCDACREARHRQDDEWNRPYRWVYDYSPPCRCETPEAPATPGWTPAHRTEEE